MFRFPDKWRYDRILHAFCINPPLAGNPGGLRSWRRPPLLFLDDPKAPNYRKNKGFKVLGNHSAWPKVAGAVIKAGFSLFYKK